MQVTDAMLDAAFDAYRAEQQRAGGLDWGLRREFLQAAIQAALDASPEQAMPQMWQLSADDGAVDDEKNAEWLRVHGAALRQAGSAVWLSKAGFVRQPADDPEQPAAVVPDEMLDVGPFHNEGGDFLPGPKRIRTGASDAAPAAEPALSADTPEALRSFTAPLDGSYDPLKLVGVGSIAGHLGVSFTQVDTWIQQGPAIRFPEPFKWTTFGPRWQLGVIDQWYQLWKAQNGG
jgi:hypothetical protein